ncbi:MAG: hypothetical protein DSZ07_07275 [Sulfurovum sp.]|nr:MAG: hypothetical protein DSZ07_07275 [Sulfurovum sp.]
MKTLFSEKQLILISFSFLFFNDCMADSQPLWEKVNSNTTKEDCLNCSVDLDFDKKISKDVQNRKSVVYAFNDVNRESKIYNNNGYKYKISKSDINPKALEFKDKVYVEKIKSANSEKRVAIQIGAFRQYSGAEKYVKKYAILSSKYKITIKTGAKNQKPLYRVQVEGFSSKVKAEEFKKKYGLVGAFLVMK